MDQISGYTETATAARRALKQERREIIQRTTRLAKHQNACVRHITAALSAGPRTIPEIAEATGIPTSEVLCFVMTLKKYGSVEEGSKVDRYYRYALSIGSVATEETRKAA